MPFIPPINFVQWLNENRGLLKPPVGNKLIWKNSQFMVMVVGGPNQRSDFHVDPSDEIFYQIEGDIQLKVIEKGILKTIDIREGELFLLAAGVPHSPRRLADTIGIVIERVRNLEEKDGFQWYCDECGNKLYEVYLHVQDIEKQLPPIFDSFFNDIKKMTCKRCGSVANKR